MGPKRLYAVVAVVVLGGLSLAGLDPSGRHLAANTLLLLAGTLAIALPVGGLLGLVLARTDVPGRGAMWSLVVASVLLPPYFHAAGWLALWGPFGWLGPLQAPEVQRYWGPIWVHGLYGAGWVALLSWIGALRIDPSLEDSARLSHTTAQVLWRVDLPQVLPALAASAAWVAALTASEITVTDLFQLRTFAEEFYIWFSLTAGQEGMEQLWRRTWPGVVWPLGLAYLVAELAPFGLLPAGERYPGRRRPMPLGTWGWAWAGALWLLIAAIAFVPLAALIHQAGTEVYQQSGQWVRTWSFGALGANLVQSLWEVRHAAGYSALLALGAAVAATLLAVPLAYPVAHRAWMTRGLWLLAATLLAVPGPHVAWAVMSLLNQPQWPSLRWAYDHTLLAPLVVQAVRSLGLMLWVAWAAWTTLPPGLVEQAKVLGCGSCGTFWRAALGARASMLFLGTCAAAVVAWNELSGTLLVLPPGVDTLPRQLFGLLHARVEDLVAGVCLVLFAACWTVALVGWFLLHRDRRA